MLQNYMSAFSRRTMNLHYPEASAPLSRQPSRRAFALPETAEEVEKALISWKGSKLLELLGGGSTQSGSYSLALNNTPIHSPAPTHSPKGVAPSDLGEQIPFTFRFYSSQSRDKIYEIEGICGSVRLQIERSISPTVLRIQIAATPICLSAD